MPSPFPGMDPYVEAPGIWPDFHLGMIAAMRSALNERLPPHYVAAGDQHVWLEIPGSGSGHVVGKSDVLVASSGRKSAGRSRSYKIPSPASTVLPGVRRLGNRYLKIFDATYRRLVTVVELLSRANKSRRRDRADYLAKRNEFLASGVNLVEMDLLRAGKRLPMGTAHLTAADYYILRCRAIELPKAGIWAISIRSELPGIPIPLDPDEPEVVLPLRACLDRAYDEGRYAARLAYDRPPVPPLCEPDASWARKILGAHRVR